MRPRYLLALPVFSFVTILPSARATIVGPYSVDTNTMHLWHLDESTTPAVDRLITTTTAPSP